MRILVTTNAAMGHFSPLAPTARALVGLGHNVRIGCPAPFAETVRDAGFEALACAEVPVSATVPAPPPADSQAARLGWAVSQSWPSYARGWVADLLAQTRAWNPDVVVVEPVEHAGRIAAAALGVPVVEHGWGFTLPHGLTQAGSSSLSDVYEAIDAKPTPPRLSIDLGASSVQASDIGPVARYRYQPWSQPGQPLPEPDHRPRLLVTLGTYENPDAAARIRRIAGAALNAGGQVLAILGNADRRTLDDFQAGIHVLDWVDLPAAIASSALVIHHAGAGTSWAALAAGRPSLVTPQMGDQFRNAALLERSGAADVLDEKGLSPTALSRTIENALIKQRLTDRALSLAEENRQLPDATELARHIASSGGSR
jgi:UDP:flavonoid glycosyltransferase YjiC (YdhE family)